MLYVLRFAPLFTVNWRNPVKVFDLLFLNGQSLLHRSTAFRKKNLRQCLKEIKGSIEFTTDYKGRTAKDIRERMDEVMAARGEGLVIKHPLSKYVLNGRNVDWIKVPFVHFSYYEIWLMFFCLRWSQSIWLVSFSQNLPYPLIFNRTIWVKLLTSLSSVNLYINISRLTLLNVQHSWQLWLRETGGRCINANMCSLWWPKSIRRRWRS